MNTQRTFAALGCTALLLAAARASAQDTGVTIHGFISQGYLDSTANNYAGAKTADGTFEFSEAALNFNAQPVPGLRVAAQLFARNLGIQGNHHVVVDWALGDYRYRDWLGVRAGRIKLPLGLYNTLRDVDMARAEILQPAALYSVTQRDLLTAFDGASVYGSVSLGKGGSLEYEAFGGTQNIDDIYVVERFVRDGAQSSLAGLGAIGLKNASYKVDRVQATMDYEYGLALVWNTPMPGLRTSATFLASKSSFQSDVTYSGTFGPAAVSIPTHTTTLYELPNACVGSVEYARGGLKVAAEYYRSTTRISSEVAGLPGPPLTIEDDSEDEAWYLQGSYRFNEHLQAQAYYSSYWPDREDKDGTRYARQKQEFRAWSKDLAVTGRVDINRHWLLKLEFHRFDGAANVSVSENPDGIEGTWNMFVAKTTFYF